VKKEDKRLGILTEIQIDEIYGVPKYDEDERFIAFSLEDFEKEKIETFRTPLAKARFILMIGYFKSKQMFFPFDFKTMRSDVDHICSRYFQNQPLDLNDVTEKTIIKYQKIIMEMFDFKPCKKNDRLKLEKRALNAASVSVNPQYVFSEIVMHCNLGRIILPSYSTLQTLVGKAIAAEKRRVEALLHNKLSVDLKKDLKSLLNKGDELCHISKIKKDAKDFGKKEMNKEIEKINVLKPIYRKALKIIPTLGISSESIKRYAALLTYYSHSKLRKMDAKTTNLYLLSFAFYKYETLYDNLIRSIFFHTKKIGDAAELMGRNAFTDLKILRNDNLEGVGEILKMFYETSVSKELKKTELRLNIHY